MEERNADWEEVVIEDDVQVVQNHVQNVDYHVLEGSDPLDAILVELVVLFHSFENLAVSVLVLTNNQNSILSGGLDLFGEVLRKHVIDLDDKTECDETLDNHGRSWGLADGDDKSCFREVW